MTTGVLARCGSCGAEARFGGAHSVLRACSFCGAVIARDGADPGLAGKAPDLVAVDTRLAVGATGRTGKTAFTVLGRLQLSRGDATWNEWYAEVGGEPAWLAEAQGRLHLTREVEEAGGALPPFDGLEPGARLELSGPGTVTVEEVAEARLVAFEGELPFRPAVGGAYRYADATGDAGGFVTLDYGLAGEPPTLWAGRIIPWSEVKLEGGAPPPTPTATATAVVCPGCGASMPRRLAESKTVVCGACHALVDTGPGAGAARHFGTVTWGSDPTIPLGAKGKLRGEPVEVIGWMRRGSRIEGTLYTWEEFLLHGPDGYRWLSTYGGHWLFLAPEPAGAVDVARDASAARGGRSYKHFQSAMAKVLQLRGEFYWDVREGEEVATEDYVAPPYLLSVERSKGEISYTHGVYVTPGEVWEGLALTAYRPVPTGVAPAQPNPHTPRAVRFGAIGAIAAVAVFAVGAYVAPGEPAQVALLEVPLKAGEVALSEPFDLAGDPQVLRVVGAANVEQAWVGMDVSLIEEETGAADTVGVEMDHWSGVDSDGPWAEGSRVGDALIGGVGHGRYVLRAEPTIEALPNATVPPVATVLLQRPVVPTSLTVLALVAVLGLPLLLAFLAFTFEYRRWSESDHPWGESS